MYHIITVDGPSGVGKSTVAKIVAKKLGFIFLSTGAIYRIVALLTKEYGINIDNELGIANICKNIIINMYTDENNEFKVFTGIRDVTYEIKDEYISKNASIIYFFSWLFSIFNHKVIILDNIFSTSIKNFS